MTWLVIGLGAFILAAGAYGALERLGRRAWLPGAARAVAWIGIGALLLNLRCPATGPASTPLVLLDGSLSFRLDSAGWVRLRDSLQSVGEVRVFGDERPTDDLESDRGRSRLAGALAAAAAGERPIQVVTDGEVEDAAEIPEGVLRRATIRVLPRRDSAPLALVRVSGPDRVTLGDTVHVVGEVRAYDWFPGDTVRLEVRLGEERLAAKAIALHAGEQITVPVPVPSNRLHQGDHILTVSVGDAPATERVTASRWLRVSVVRTPGVVMVASPADWDARFLYRALGEVSQLPVRGYARLVPGTWRSMDDLASVPERTVREATRQADLLVLKGDPSDVAAQSRARAEIRWPSGEHGEAVIEGDWYISTPAASPIAGAFVSVPVDSLPPAFQITPVQPDDAMWVGLLAQLGRRGALRPILTGGIDRGRRVVTVSADGLWRWAFAGGAGEQGYRNLVAAITTWLLAAPDTVAGRALPVRGVVERARPLLFRWQAPTAPEPTTITLVLGETSLRDTLRFDGQGLARLWLPVGAYRYSLGGSGAGVVAVEPYSDEWLPRPVNLQRQEGVIEARGRYRSAREALWLFALVVVALAIEWLIRRRMGLR